jgi:hypothetical protein
MKELVLSDIDVFLRVSNINQLRARFSSFGNDFCCAYFAHEKVREFHRLHMDLIFGAGDPATLCIRTKQSCCRKKSHSPACVEAWAQVRTFLQLGMFQELDKVNKAKARPKSAELGLELEELQPELGELQPEVKGVQPKPEEGIQRELRGIQPEYPDFGVESKGLERPEDSELDAGTTMESLYGPRVWEEEGFCLPTA